VVSDVPLTDCWVWVWIDPEGEASILGYRSGDYHYPLIATDEETREHNTKLAHVMHSEKMGAPEMHHLHFTNCEELEIIK
jgi:hypothetical protein